MPIEITMPKLSDTMEEGTILHWFKHEGDPVERGEVLAEVETDKADMELEAAVRGTLSEIRVKEGEAAPVGAVIAILSDAGVGDAAVQATRLPPAQPVQQEERPPPRTAKGAVPPVVRKGSPAAPPPAAKMEVPPRSEPLGAARGREALSKLRLTVAKQMAVSKREVPHFYVTVEIDMSEAARLRASLAASGIATSGTATSAAIPERITFTHLIMRAVAITLPRHPRVNASWSDGSIAYHDDINIAVAVAVEDGLLAPVVRGCQQLSLRQIARVTAELVNKAQGGRFSGDELTGATFTLSNMGMLDIEEFSAVITPPQAAILAVGAIKDRAVVRNGQLAVAKTMRVTLSVDHRVLNGVEAGRFLEDLKTVLENPLPLVMAPD